MMYLKNKKRLILLTKHSLLFEIFPHLSVAPLEKTVGKTGSVKRTLTGFTLIEILLVVVLLGIMVGLVIPNFGPTYANIQLKETAQNISYLMRYAQSRAIIKNGVHRLAFDSYSSKYWLLRSYSDEQGGMIFEGIPSRLGRVFRIPEGIKVESDHHSVDFYPDGKIEKVRIYLSNKNKRTYTISTEEQTGYVFTFDFRVP